METTNTLENFVGAKDITAGTARGKRFTNEEIAFLEELGSFEAPYLEEKLLEEGTVMASSDYKEAFGEFKRFVVLTKLYDRKISMISEKVDAVWHQFILFTKQYHQFCDNFLGAYLHHVPRTSFTPLAEGGKERFVELYRRTFGEIPAIWNIQKGSCSACGEGCAPSGMCSADPDD